MRRIMRSILVALLVAMMTFNPASACRFCGGGYGSDYGGRGRFASRVYYGGCAQPMCYESCVSCGGESYYGDCCGGEVVVCEGCGDCCGACEGCACEGQAATPSDVEPSMAAPEPQAPEPEGTPSTVNRLPTEPAPSLAPQALPSTPEAEMHSMPTAEPSFEAPAALPETTTPPPAETPALEPMAPTETIPTEEPTNGLFGEPAADESPLPAEEPATPAETDDFFNAPVEAPATDTAPSTPAAEPAAAPSSQPTDDDLFGPPAEEGKPADEAAPPAEEKADENDDLFGRSEAILGMPGGLASHSLRHWVDNTGSFSCDGRLVRVLGGKVQLRKANGRTTTVPLDRLSQADLEFVNRQASAQQAEVIGKTAQVSTGWSN